MKRCEAAAANKKHYAEITCLHLVYGQCIGKLEAVAGLLAAGVVECLCLGREHHAELVSAAIIISTTDQSDLVVCLVPQPICLRGAWMP